jgi:hypothetical protein
MLSMQPPTDRLAVFYLLRGADAFHLESLRRFVKAYGAYSSGIDHDLFVIFKGFPFEQALEDTRAELRATAFQEIHTGDESFDLGAYADAIMRTPCRRACFLNTSSEPAASHWLLKLSRALDLSGVGLAGASGSFETGVGGSSFPNVHVRTNAFMMDAALARSTLGRVEIKTKRDAHLAEHGIDSLTCQVVRRGLSAVIVGANGRAYAPAWWNGSRTFRQGDQSNLLVLDNQTRAWDAMTWPERRIAYNATWGAARTPGQPFGDPRS